MHVGAPLQKNVRARRAHVFRPSSRSACHPGWWLGQIILVAHVSYYSHSEQQKCLDSIQCMHFQAVESLSPEKAYEGHYRNLLCTTLNLAYVKVSLYFFLGGGGALFFPPFSPMINASGFSKGKKKTNRRKRIIIRNHLANLETGSAHTSSFFFPLPFFGRGSARQLWLGAERKEKKE